MGEGVSGDEAGVWVSVALTPGGRLRSEKMAGNEGGRDTPSKGMPWTPWGWDPDWQENGKLESVARVLRSLAMEGRRADSGVRGGMIHRKFFGI